jgi:hypothetical protein
MGAPFVYDPEDAATQRDPYPAYCRLRDEHPVYRQDRLGFYALSRHADVMEALRDHETFCSRLGLTWDTTAAEQAGVLPMLVTTDPPAHTKLRGLVNRGLTPRRVAALEDDVRAVVVEHVERLRRAGGGDLVEDLAVPLPTAVIGRFLGVPPADRHRFHEWAVAVVSGTSGVAYHEAHHRATRELYQYFRARVEQARAAPGDDLLGALVTAEIDGARLSTEDVLGFCFNLIVGGIETTTNVTTAGLVLLQDHSALRDALAAAPARIPAAIEEFLRLETPVQGLCRTTTRAVERHGVVIPEGTKVLLLFGAANRDPRAFADPDALRLDRDGEPHLAFGFGAHYCIGAALARLMGRVAFAEALARLGDLRIDVARGARVPSAVNRGWRRLPARVG